MNAYKHLKILIVDDETINIELASIYLENEDFTIVTAKSAQDALAILSKEKIALILLDVNMPEIDGFTLCSMLKAEQKSKDIPIVFLTANQDIKHITHAFEIGGADYITKPFNILELKARIRVQLQNILYMEDIKQKQSKLAQLSITDQLTKLHNAFYFESYIKTLQSKKQNCWILYIKIHHFEKINQLYGFHNANKILRTFANVIAKNSYKNAIVSRLFGAHFAIVTKTYTQEDMQKFYKHLLDAIAEEKILNNTIHIAAMLIYTESTKKTSVADIYKKMQKNLVKLEERGRQLLVIT
jgi:diguanylate cyclase (GGDEF)-like protein